VEHGTTTQFAALSAKSSEMITRFHHRHRSAQFQEFLDVIEAHVAKHLEVHIYGNHRTTLARKWFV
jgi:hypothetical protein